MSEHDNAEPPVAGRIDAKVRHQRLKVWGGLVFMGTRGQLRAVVAATSQAKAAEALHCTLSELRGWWSETGNKAELAAALSKPGQVFMQTTQRGEYTPKVRVGGAWVDA